MGVLFLSDIDGTLVDSHDVPVNVKKAIKEFTIQGNWFSLATGRNAFAIRWLVDELVINAPCIILTGAALYDSKKDALWNIKPLPEQCKKALRLLHEGYPTMGIQVFTRSGLCNLRLNSFLQEHGIPEEIACSVSDIQSLENQEILKIGLCCEDVKKIELATKELFSDKLQYKWHYSHVIGAEVFSPMASKGIALKALIESMPEIPDLVAVAGDSPNDLSMFEHADVTFAPETAFPEVREAADYIIPSPKEGGVAQAINILMNKI